MTHLQFASDLFNGTKKVSSNYHVNLIRRVAVVLGVDPVASLVFRHTAMTALVKCQSAGDKTAKVPGGTISTCTGAYLLREIALYRPVYLLALGNEPFEFLTSPGMQALHRLKVGKLWHPSWSNMPGGEAAYFEHDLPRLHREYASCLREAGRDRDDLEGAALPRREIQATDSNPLEINR